MIPPAKLAMSHFSMGWENSMNEWTMDAPSFLFISLNKPKKNSKDIYNESLEGALIINRGANG